MASPTRAEDAPREEEEAPQSISSLRSKFESLAATNAGQDAGPGSAGARKPSTAGKINLTTPVGLGIGSADTSNDTSVSVPSSRPETPVLTAKVGASSPIANSDTTSSNPVKKVPPPKPAKPIIMSTPASPTPASPPALAEGISRQMSSSPLSNAEIRSTTPTPTLPQPIRRPAPSVPAKGPSSITSPSTAMSGAEDLGPAPSVKALRDRFAGGLTADAGPSRILTTSPSAIESSGRVSRGSMARQVSVPLEQSGGTVVAEPISVSGLSTSPSPTDSNYSLAKKVPPPPRPISRSASPTPPQPDRSTKPIPTKPPVQSLPSQPRAESPPVNTRKGPDAPAPRPALPTRRPIPSDSDMTSPAASGPPPIPGNRPSTEIPSRRENSAEIGSGPPKLPIRTRAHTVSRSEDSKMGPPPPLPTRQATTSISSLTGVSDSPPHSLSTSLPVSPARARDVPDASDYQPPPPPVRNSASMPTPPRRSETHPPARASGDLSSEDDEEEEPAALSNLPAGTKRVLEEYPDSTHANRRPPKFSPDIRMVQPHHIYAFAVHGRHVCTGAHHLRIYDTQMSERPISIVDLRETGLEFRVKEPRISAMCFRPGAHPSDEGRYLWCGTRDGHIFEIDIMTGQVSDAKPAAHGAAVSHIFRYDQQILTLDEAGKLLVYEVPGSQEKDSNTAPVLIRTQRISERSTFARLIQGKLWTATAPQSRSTTTTASKGATIRVYEPCAHNPPPARTLFTTEWTGAVTSATIIPFAPETVYLGHEGGFVSIWSSEDMVCQQVIKISASDILALEGCGERLWAGNRKGQIWVYDVSQKPWQASNIWMAHPDHPIQMLLVDPWSIEQTGRCAIWSTTRDQICAWDGLLSVDWIDSQMNLRQADYCSYREINTVVCSWNIDSAKPSELGGSEANTLFLEHLLNSVDSPDVIIFGFQEVIPLTDKKLTAKTLLFGGKHKEAGATADKVSSAYRQWLDKLTSAVRNSTATGCSYTKIHSESLVGLFTCIFVKTDLREGLRDVDICVVKRGLGNIYGNKGAIVARMVIDDTSLCFINVHLAAGQSQKVARTADLNAIMEDKAILPASDDLPYVHGGDGTAILDHELVILNGDLNYRIDQRRENVLSNISAGDLNYLLEHDQLRKELLTNHGFRLRSFDEPQITFAPTYKYNRGSTEYDTSEKKRIPAWCDRILYTRNPNIVPLNYLRYEVTVSDHRPISAGFKMKIKKVDRGLMGVVRGEVGVEWTKQESEMLERMAKAFRTMA